MTAILVIDRVRDEVGAIGSELLDAQRGRGSDEPGVVNVGRAASYMLAARQELDAAIEKGFGVGVIQPVVTLTPGEYIAKRRQAAGLSVNDVAARIGTEPRVSEIDRAEWIGGIEDGTVSPTVTQLATLRRIFPFDEQVLARLAAIADGRTVAEPRVCSICACSRLDACRHTDHPCHWVAADLCSACAPVADAAAAPVSLEAAA